MSPKDRVSAAIGRTTAYASTTSAPLQRRRAGSEQHSGDLSRLPGSLLLHALDGFVGRPHRMGEKALVYDGGLIAVALLGMARSGRCVPDHGHLGATLKSSRRWDSTHKFASMPLKPGPQSRRQARSARARQAVFTDDFIAIPKTVTKVSARISAGRLPDLGAARGAAPR